MEESLDAKILFKQMLKENNLTMKEAVDQYNILHPDNTTSTQNLSNKFSKGTIRFQEMINLIGAIGYEISFRKIDSMPQAQIENYGSEIHKHIKAIDIPSKNLGIIMIVGYDANEAAEFYHKNFDEEMTKAMEEVLCVSICNHFNSIARPVPTIEHFFEQLPNGKTKLTTVQSVTKIL